MIRPILRHGADVLHNQANPVVAFDQDLGNLIDDMIQTMYAASGVGLAAPQIGIGLRVFVADPSAGRSSDELIAIVNPEIVEEEGTQLEEEGCLSLPGFSDQVTRPSRILVTGFDREGTQLQIEGCGLLARVLHHELDHLDGNLFVKRLRGLRRDKISRRVRKLQRSGKW